MLAARAASGQSRDHKALRNSALILLGVLALLAWVEWEYPGDEDDYYFRSVENRAVLEHMLEHGRAGPGVLDRIVNSNVRIHVDVYRGDGYDFVVVNVLD